MKKNLVFFLSFLLLNLAARAQCTFSGSTSFCSGTTIGGGTWSSSNTAVATVDPTTGAITGISIGTATLTYTTSLGYITTAISITDVASVAAISGASSVCAGSTTNFSNSTPGGTWSSSNTAIANINSSGVVSGIAAGTATITYTVANSCGSSYVIKGITVTDVPTVTAITGTFTTCAGTNTTLASATGGGTWTSSTAAVATVNSTTGMVHGISAGSTTITYSVTNGCGTSYVTQVVNITGQSAGTISGADTVCSGATISLTSTGATGTGTWASANPSALSVSSAGVVTGNAKLTAALTSIYYIVSGSCGIDTAIKRVYCKRIAFHTGVSQVCIGGSGVVNISPSFSALQWVSGTGAITGTTSTAAGMFTGNYLGSDTLIITVPTTSTSCADTDKVGVNVANIPAKLIAGVHNVTVGNFIFLSSNNYSGLWSSSATSIASINAPGTAATGKNAYGISVGAAIISYVGGAACPYTDTLMINVRAAARMAQPSVPTIGIGKTVNLFPNPNHGIFTLELPEGVTAAAVTVTNTSGKVILSKISIKNSIDFDISQYPRGMYMITVDAGDKKYNSKVMLE